MNATGAAGPGAAETRSATEDSPTFLMRRHLRVGWISLLVFLTLGLALESLHGFKVQAYINVMNETRRLMWTLAHAHGTLLGLLNLGFAFTASCTPNWPSVSRIVASYALIGSTLLMPAGFFLGGVWIYAGDPGLGILLVPIGGVLLFTAALLSALSLKYFHVDLSKNRGNRPGVSKSK